MKKNINLIIFSCLLMLFLTINITKADAFNYSVNPILNHQMSKIGYYKIKVEKSQVVKLKFKLKNYSSKKILVNNFTNDAHNDNGSIIYNRVLNDSYHRTNPTFDSMVVGQNKKISLKPYGSKILNLKIKIPKSGINGQVLGGINSFKNNKTNNFNFSNAILLENKKGSDDFKNVFVKNIRPDQSEVNFNLYNNQPYIISKYKINFKLFNRNQKLVNKNEYDYSMVPDSKSKVNFGFDDLASGFYYLKIRISDQKGHEKYYKKYFTINGKNKKRTEEKASLTAPIIAVLLTFIYFLIIKIIAKIKRRKAV